MCSNIQRFVVSEKWSLQKFSIKECKFFWLHFACKFDCGVEGIGEINEVADFFSG